MASKKLIYWLYESIAQIDALDDAIVIQIAQYPEADDLVELRERVRELAASMREHEVQVHTYRMSDKAIISHGFRTNAAQVETLRKELDTIVATRDFADSCVVTIEQIEQEGERAYRENESAAPINNPLVHATLTRIDPIVGDPRFRIMCDAFKRGFERARAEMITIVDPKGTNPDTITSASGIEYHRQAYTEHDRVVYADGTGRVLVSSEHGVSIARYDISAVPIERYDSIADALDDADRVDPKTYQPRD